MHSPDPPTRTTASRSHRVIVPSVIVASVAAALAVQAPAYPNHDVSYLTWVANRMWNSAVFGRDIREVNPPLAALIYAPAAMAGSAMGAAIKLWVAAIACLSMATLSRALPSDARIPALAALGLFFAFAFPREFGQREQIALLLCAPYAAGPIKARGWAALSGAMAGIGFAIKPHFLIALLFVFGCRRRLGTEEKMIVATGLFYAATLLLAFQYYLLHLPEMLGVYWGNGEPHYLNPRVLYFTAEAAPALALGWLNRDRRGAGLALACAGFAVAAIAQGKFFAYHFLAAWGFLTLYLATQLAYPRWRWLASLLLLAVAVRLSLWALPWARDMGQRNAQVTALVREIDASDGFIALSVHPYPAFPAAIYASQPYLGASAGIGELGVIGKLEKAGRPVPPALAGSARHAVLADLDQRPGLVIVPSDWSQFDDLAGYDALRWLQGDAEFRHRWAAYAPAGRVDDYRLFRRVR